MTLASVVVLGLVDIGASLAVVAVRIHTLVLLGSWILIIFVPGVGVEVMLIGPLIPLSFLVEEIGSLEIWCAYVLMVREV